MQHIVNADECEISRTHSQPCPNLSNYLASLGRCRERLLVLVCSLTLPSLPRVLRGLRLVWDRVSRGVPRADNNTSYTNERRSLSSSSRLRVVVFRGCSSLEVCAGGSVVGSGAIARTKRVGHNLSYRMPKLVQLFG